MTAVSQVRSSSDSNRIAYQTMAVWGLFFVVNGILHETIPFALSNGTRNFVYSVSKDVLYHFAMYGLIFLVIPLVLSKGWKTVRQPSFILPMIVAVGAITLRPLVPLAPVLVVVALFFLHRRFDLSDLGIRSHGWKADLVAVVLLALISSIPLLMRTSAPAFDWQRAFLALVDRMLGNPAASVEILFYYGFLTQRLAPLTGNWLTPPLVGLMYAAHEMENPEYWASSMSFPLVFVGVTLMAAIYLWRRSIVVAWLGDGLVRFLGRLV